VSTLHCGGHSVTSAGISAVLRSIRSGSVSTSLAMPGDRFHGRTSTGRRVRIASYTSRARAITRSASSRVGLTGSPG
jgi:hypothetical protein